MLKTYADSDGLRLDKDLRTMQVAVDVTCRVPRSQQHWAVEGTIPRADDTTHLPTLEDQLLHTAREVHLTTRGDDLLAHTTDDDGELVRTDMWVGIDEDLRVGTEATEDTKDLLHAATLLATRIELAVREGTRTVTPEVIEYYIGVSRSTTTSSYSRHSSAVTQPVPTASPCTSPPTSGTIPSR